ncbi:hypothetical protein OXYTRIMIC_782 [Oxytricha trifallax]|uniref:Ubiquitin-like protease family profile domain-containing protein n=1 Tax=Oxytricha trifallax TaxID=1172189 RepID=A0A073HYF8_9SPIT|nr:hypothetical protein OXYTRIMIC_782 [Oxytricha trifallax]
MNKTSFSKTQEEEKQGNQRDRITSRQNHGNEKREFWRKVQEVRFNHRDRSRDQEALGMRNEEKNRIPLNKQMGFKSRLKIGKSNPSKKINESKSQRTQFDKHEDGSECILGDQMKFKKFIDLSEVTCQGFDKIIYTKKGWTPTTSKFITIVCCPSARTKLEKALVRKYDERQAARNRGMREQNLWSQRQHEHWKEINQEWKHFDLIPGNHISEERFEVTTNQIEEAQFNQGKTGFLILPPLVVDDRGILSLEKIIGITNWKLDNGRFWRDTEALRGVIIPICCKGSLRNCKNWVIVKVEREAKTLEIYDTRRAIGSFALIQKHLGKVNELIANTVGNDFKVNKLQSMVNTNQVSDPEDCGIMAILITNHLALELQGEPIFQIFAKDWINMQRYYILFNMEVVFMKMKIGRSGVALSDDEIAEDTEKRNEGIWQQSSQELTAGTYVFNSQIDQWDDVVMREDQRGEIEQEFIANEGRFSELAEEVPEIEEILFPNKMKHREEGREENSDKRNTQDAEGAVVEGTKEQIQAVVNQEESFGQQQQVKEADIKE